jgi:hypothetical protein
MGLFMAALTLIIPPRHAFLLQLCSPPNLLPQGTKAVAGGGEGDAARKPSNPLKICGEEEEEAEEEEEQG